MTPLQRWLLALAITTVIVIICFYWFDRPIAFWVHAHLGASGRGIFEPFTLITDPLAPAAVIAFFSLGLRALAGRPLTWRAAVVTACSVSVIVAQAAKLLLKFVFGRAWPETWTHNNPSLIHDSAYSFNWFRGGVGYESFPSGHMATICAVMSVLWICYPRLKPIWAFGALAVGIALIGANFHYLGDVVAGSFVGISSGWMTTALLDCQRYRSNGKHR